MRHRRLTHGALVGRSRSLGKKLHIIRPGSLTSYCLVPVTWRASEKHMENVCKNCINQMARET